jgi:hypothetical protein
MSITIDYRYNDFMQNINEKDNQIHTYFDIIRDNDNEKILFSLSKKKRQSFSQLLNIITKKYYEDWSPIIYIEKDILDFTTKNSGFPIFVRRMRNEE